MARPPRNKLSSSEVAALVDGLKGLDSDASDPGAKVRSYKLGHDNQAMLGDYHGLRMVNERFCRVARSVFLPFLRFHPRISGFPPEIKSFARYCDEQDNFTSLTLSRIEELRGVQMIVLSPSFVSLLTDAYFGGSLRSPTLRRQEFTATEARVIELVTEGLNKALAQAWRDLTALSFQIQSHEENLQFATFVDGKDMIVCCSFIMQLPGVDPANIDILYPVQTLKPIAPLLRSRAQSDILEEDLGWRARLERAVLSVPLDVSARLAEPVVALSELQNAQPGQLMTLDLAPDLRLLVEGQPLFEAELGDIAGRSAVSLKRALLTP